MATAADLARHMKQQHGTWRCHTLAGGEQGAKLATRLMKKAERPQQCTAMDSIAPLAVQLA
jgi:tripartite-type tricarboxylate transporter receptor subunit TctC